MSTKTLAIRPFIKAGSKSKVTFCNIAYTHLAYACRNRGSGKKKKCERLKNDSNDLISPIAHNFNTQITVSNNNK